MNPNIHQHEKDGACLGPLFSHSLFVLLYVDHICTIPHSSPWSSAQFVY